MSKVHPIPRKRNISIRYDVTPALTESTAQTGFNNRQKKLRRLPHIFAKVLELPFCSSTADVSVYESPNSFRFTIAADAADVRVQMVQICPGVVKIVICGDESLVDELEIDVWRFRLPDCTRPEMATADCVDGELVVVVPKGEDYSEDGRNWRRDANGRVVIVQ